MQVLNLKREFKIQKMKRFKSIREYGDWSMIIVNKIKMLGEELFDKRVMGKVLVRLLETFESKISSLEDSKDLSQITFAKLINALQP